MNQQKIKKLLSAGWTKRTVSKTRGKIKQITKNEVIRELEELGYDPKKVKIS